LVMIVVFHRWGYPLTVPADFSRPERRRRIGLSYTPGEYPSRGGCGSLSGVPRLRSAARG